MLSGSFSGWWVNPKPPIFSSVFVGWPKLELHPLNLSTQTRSFPVLLKFYPSNHDHEYGNFGPTLETIGTKYHQYRHDINLSRVMLCPFPIPGITSSAFFCFLINPWSMTWSITFGLSMKHNFVFFLIIWEGWIEFGILSNTCNKYYWNNRDLLLA